jgi:hypothetical protein
MRNIYSYFIYRVYSWNLRRWGENDNPSNNAIIGLSSIQCFHLLSLFLIIQILFNIEILDFFQNNKYLIVLLSIIIYLINYIFYIKYNYLDYYCKKFVKEGLQLKKKNTKIITIFVILSILVPIILALLIRLLSI